jgi:NAD(P)-dependent dehydrogenase (short-subunit alcohol dehydrogenase family)
MLEELFGLRGKVALVTGAGSGLGREFALALAGSGARVLCVDRDRERAERIAAEIDFAGGTSLAVVTDVAVESEVSAMVQRACEAFGTVDVLVNNAGIASAPARMHELAVADWDRLVAVNLRGVFLCSRAIVPIMLEQTSGSIINISSIIGMGGFYPGFPSAAVNYSATKAGVIGFTRQTAAEYAADNIRVNAIAPGYHGGTQLGAAYRSIATPEQIKRLEGAIHERIPMGRRGVPSELRGLVLYLAGDASRYVTGQVFAHDGGWTAV